MSEKHVMANFFNRSIVILLLALGVTGCSYVSFPGVYRIDIPQGNVIEEEMLAQLQLGMSPSQVQFVMGTPLITDPFNLNRWDYYYSLSKDGEKIEQYLVTLTFKNNQLVTIDNTMDTDSPIEAEPAKDVPLEEVIPNDKDQRLEE